MCLAEKRLENGQGENGPEFRKSSGCASSPARATRALLAQRIHRALRRAHIVISGLSGPTSAALNCRLLPSRRIGLPMPAAVAIGDDHRSPCCSAPPRRQPFWSACRHRSCMQRICMTLDRIFRRPDRVFSPGVPDGWVPINSTCGMPRRGGWRTSSPRY